jgi:copper chaperone NosL
MQTPCNSKIKETATMPTKVIKGLLLLIALFAITMAFVRFNEVTLPEGAVPVVWDGEVCGHCKMHVGDPRFAAQLQTTAGDVVNFDDPGCLFDYLQSHEVSVHALFFRNHDEDGWLTESEVGFLPVEDSPMGYGIRAVPKDTPVAKDIDWAKGQVINRPDHPHGGS